MVSNVSTLETLYSTLKISITTYYLHLNLYLRLQTSLCALLYTDLIFNSTPF